MSAHIVTAISQLKGEVATGKVNWNFIQHALDTSCWTEQLELEQWERLGRLVQAQDTAGLTRFLRGCEAEYGCKWHDLSQPKTREEWINVEYERIFGGRNE